MLYNVYKNLNPILTLKFYEYLSFWISHQLNKKKYCMYNSQQIILSFLPNYKNNFTSTSNMFTYIEKTTVYVTS